MMTIQSGWADGLRSRCQQTASLIKLSQKKSGAKDPLNRAAITLDLVLTWLLSQSEDITTDFTFKKKLKTTLF